MTAQAEQDHPLIRLIQDVAVAAIGNRSSIDALQTAVDRIRQYNAWRVAHAYRRSASGRTWLPLPIWSIDRKHADRVAAFVEETMASPMRRGEAGWGEPIERGEPCWIEDLGAHEDWQRRSAIAVGLRAAAVFPVRTGGDTVVALEFFSDVPIPREPAFIEAMRNIGLQLGLALERDRLQREVVDLTEGETRRLSRQLHDSLGQQVAGTSMLAESLHTRLSRRDAPEAEQAARIRDSLREVHSELRRIAHGLRPVSIGPDELPAALGELASGTEALYSIQCHAEIGTPHPAPVDDSATATHLYRIAQEAVHNAAAHGRATLVRIVLSQAEGQTQLAVHDDGKGIPADTPGTAGMGLRIMRYRSGLIGGWLTIESSPRGTTVRCRVPQEAEALDAPGEEPA